MKREVIDKQHRIRTRLLELGAQRQKAQEELAAIDSEIGDLIDPAAKAGLALTEVEQLTGVTRPTLYRWASQRAKKARRK